MPYCHEGWQNGNWISFPNPACYCPDEAWKNMAVVPYVGKALSVAATAANTAAQQSGAVTGVVRMLSGSIPRSWGRKADGSLAAWHDNLMSM